MGKGKKKGGRGGGKAGGGDPSATVEKQEQSSSQGRGKQEFVSTTGGGGDAPGVEQESTSHSKGKQEHASTRGGGGDAPGVKEESTSQSKGKGRGRGTVERVGVDAPGSQAIKHSAPSQGKQLWPTSEQQQGSQQQPQVAWQSGSRQQQQQPSVQPFLSPAQSHQQPRSAWQSGYQQQQHPPSAQQFQTRGQSQQQSRGAEQSGRRQPHGSQQSGQVGRGRPRDQRVQVPGGPIVIDYQQPSDPHQDRRGSTASVQSHGSEKQYKSSPEPQQMLQTPTSKSSGQGERVSPQKQMPTSAHQAGSETKDKYSILNLRDQMSQMSIIPKKNIVPGKKGRPIQIETNYLSLNLGKLTVAYHFDVEIIPDTPKKFLRDVMEEFRRRHFSRYHPSFDGRKNLYSPHMLVQKGQPINDEIVIRDGDRQKSFKVQVQFANMIDLTPLHQIKMTTLSPQEAIQCVEIVLRSAPSLRCIQAGRSFFTRPARIIDLGEGMEMYQGFYQSVVRGWKPFLNVDVAHKAFPKESDVINLIIELCSSYHNKMTSEDLKNRRLERYQIETVQKFLKTLRIVYEIRGQAGSKREYRVNGISDCPRDKKFRPDNGPEMTIEDYFARKKNYRLNYPLMPTLWVGNLQRPDPILLPAELCTVLPGQAVNRKMTENQTSTMIKYAATSTDVRKGKIMTSLQNTNHNQDLCIREFGFSIGNGFEKIGARVLDPPTLEYDQKAIIRPTKGVWRQDNATFLKGASINSWTIISACGQQIDESLRQLADMIYKFGPKCGMSLSSRASEPFQSLRGRPPSYRDIEVCLRKCHEKKNDLVFVVIPDSGPTYSDVKRAAEINIGCLTQCIKKRTLFKLNPATVNNILLKVNSKLNGTNHCLNIRPPILSVPCMIMGADVTHPSPDSTNIPSVAAVTASHDPKAFCYNICVRLQSPKVEIIADLEEIVVEHLMFFYKQNRQQKPQRLVFFRDGVSEGQFIEVILQEVAAIRRACKKLQADYEPKITFLVVQKRHHTRFFPMNKRDSDDRNFNVPAGTCVDSQITNPNMQDFYLVSHASIQGVAKPTKYCTLWDDNNLDHDQIEELTYHLCHLFTRCNRSVSYPAPTYYAHLAAARAKVYIENLNLNLHNLAQEQRKINILEVIRKEKPMFFV